MDKPMRINAGKLLTSEMLEQWLSENAAPVANGGGAFCPSLRLRPDGVYTIEWLFDERIYTSKCALPKDYADWAARFYEPTHMFNEFLEGVPEVVRRKMVKVLGVDEGQGRYSKGTEEKFINSSLLYYTRNYQKMEIEPIKIKDDRTQSELMEAYKNAKASLDKAATEEEKSSARTMLYDFYSAQIAEIDKKNSELRRRAKEGAGKVTVGVRNYGSA